MAILKRKKKIEAPRQGLKRNPDIILALLVFALVIFGLVMISSASVVLSYEVTGGRTNNYYLIRQLTSLVIGLVALIILQAVDYHRYKKFALPLLLLTIIVLAVPAFPEIFKGLAFGYGGAYRWIHIGPLFFQPSEIVKLTFIIYLAAWFERRKDELSKFTAGVIPFVIILGIVVFLIMKQPDLGTTSIIGIIGISMFFVAGAHLAHLGLGVILGAGGLWELIRRSPYRLARLLVFLNPASDTLGKGYHVNQALLAIGSGGFWGLGFGQSRQKYNYLPQASTDSIFAIIAEELGFARSVIVIAAFFIFAYKGFNIAMKAPDLFGRLLAAGITSWIVFQAVINIGTMLAVFPLTGVPLPFISYGGSSLIINLAAIGILLNVSRQTV